MLANRMLDLDDRLRVVIHTFQRSLRNLFNEIRYLINA
jgi:hypothetical protein